MAKVIPAVKFEENMVTPYYFEFESEREENALVSLPNFPFAYGKFKDWVSNTLENNVVLNAWNNENQHHVILYFATQKDFQKFTEASNNGKFDYDKINSKGQVI